MFISEKRLRQIIDESIKQITEDEKSTIAKPGQQTTDVDKIDISRLKKAYGVDPAKFMAALGRSQENQKRTPVDNAIFADLFLQIINNPDKLMELVSVIKKIASTNSANKTSSGEDKK